jgi:4'-phosphopantetheinyl transferase
VTGAAAGAPILLAIEPVTPAAARASLGRLSADERARVARIRRAARANAVAVSLDLARRSLADATGVPPGELEFTRTCERCGHLSHGRPRLVPDAVEFSVSRSERWAVVALAPVPVGVDLEDPARAAEATELAPVLSAAERRWLDGRKPGELLDLWVMKEAAGKAMGFGIVDVEDLSVVTSESDDLMGWRAVAGAPDGHWSVTRIEAPGVLLAVAVAGAPRPIEVNPPGWGVTARPPSG